MRINKQEERGVKRSIDEWEKHAEDLKAGAGRKAESGGEQEDEGRG